MDFSKLDGLIPAVIQDELTGEVLMVGFMNDQAFRLTQATGYATFYSRTRNTLWTKGETSGNRLRVIEVLTDCDEDTVLLKVSREGDGNVCHTGTRSCFSPLPASTNGSRLPAPGFRTSADRRAGSRKPEAGSR